MPGGRLSDSTTAGYGSDLVVDLLYAVGPALRRALRVVKDEGRPALVEVITWP